MIWLHFEASWRMSLGFVVTWLQVGEYAAVTDLVWLRRLGLVLDDAKKEGLDQGICPCH